MDQKTKDLRMQELFRELRDLTSEEMEISPGGIGVSFQKEAPHSTRFWLIEIWSEKREVFKEFIAEVIFFGLFLGSLDVFHRLIARTSLEPEQILLLNKTHFYLVYFALLIFGLSFIITVGKLLFAGGRND